MSEASDIVRRLSAPFPRDQISWRAQNLKSDGTAALALAYIDARDVMDRLDEVCGPENWQDRYEFHGARTICNLSVRLDGEWITKADGAGDTDVEGEKGAISDALKRAAVKWGVGRYLYSLESPWVPCESYDAGGKKRWKRWSADPWKHVRNADTVSPPSRSAASLKRTDENGEDDWDRLLKEVHAELLDCHTLTGLARLRADYRVKARERRWPREWLEALGGQFDEAEAKLEAGITSEPQANGKNAYLDAMRAG